jgi:putative intracellular protease/amidase
MSDREPIIVFALFPGVTQLDFTGPHMVFSRLPGAQVILASAAGGAIETDGIVFAGLRRLAEIAACDVICVPGGAGVTDNAIADEVFLGELRRLAATARFVTSVCTGSLALGAAGLLRGKRAACHWASVMTLPSRTTRPESAIAPNGANNSRHVSAFVARLRRIDPADR